MPEDSGNNRLCLIRGGGDLATGVAWRLTRTGFEVVVTELAEPLTVRRTVAVSSAVLDGVVDVEGMTARLATNVAQAQVLAARGEVAVLVSRGLPETGASVVVDARLAKHNIDTTIEDAPLVVGLGPGFTAGVDCDAVVETMRGHHLGRVLWEGAALPDTGTPGLVAGRDVERVLRAPVRGRVMWSVEIGDSVSEGDRVGVVGAEPVVALFDGVVRGLISGGSVVPAGLKIGDVDPRLDAAWNQISDKALAIGGGVVEAVMTWSRRQS